MKLAPRLVILHYYTAWLMEFGFEKEDTENTLVSTTVEHPKEYKGTWDMNRMVGIELDETGKNTSDALMRE